MFLLLQSDCNYFDYEDIVGKLRFDKFIAEYFVSIIKISSVEELFKEYIDYLKVKEDYWFESADKTILTNLSGNDKTRFVELIKKESENVKEKDYAMHDLIYFQLDMAKSQKNKELYYSICDKYGDLLDKNQKEEFNEDYSSYFIL